MGFQRTTNSNEQERAERTEWKTRSCMLNIVLRNAPARFLNIILVAVVFLAVSFAI